MRSATSTTIRSLTKAKHARLLTDFAYVTKFPNCSEHSVSYSSWPISEKGEVITTVG